MSIFMMTREVAELEKNIAGLGRRAPNKNPYLPAPVRLHGGVTSLGSGGIGAISSITRGSLSLPFSGGSGRRAPQTRELEGWGNTGAANGRPPPPHARTASGTGDAYPTAIDGGAGAPLPTAPPPAAGRQAKAKRAGAAAAQQPGAISAISASAGDSGAGVGFGG